MIDLKSAILFPPLVKLKVGDFQDLYDQIPEVKSKFEESSEILGIDLPKLFFSDDVKVINSSSIARTSIVTISSALHDLLQRVLPNPNYYLGPSLGMVSAIHCSGGLDFKQTIEMVRTFCEFEEEDKTLKKYGVYFFYNIDLKIMEELMEGLNREGYFLEVCVYMNSSQMIVNGDFHSLEALSEKITKYGGLGIQIPYGPPGHCTLLTNVKRRFEKECLDRIQFGNSKIPVIGNSAMDILQTKDAIKNELIEQYCKPVLWGQSLFKLKEMGIEHLYFLGPGNFIYKSLEFSDVSFRTSKLLSAEDIHLFFEKSKVGGG